MSHPFFKNHGPFKVSQILNFLDLDIKISNEDNEINDIKDLMSSTKNDITFFHSNKYRDLAKITKASYCLTTENLKSILPNSELEK